LRWKVLVGLFGLVLLAVAGALGVHALSRVGVSQGYAPEQPIDFSHALHAGSGPEQFQIPCLYCHFGAERSRHAGIPPASVCMNCHREIAKPSIELERLKLAVAQDRPIEWKLIHKLPDFAFFSHRQHVGGGVACQDCHGPVETMERVHQESPLTMGWCIDCHRQRGITEFSPRAQTAAAAVQETAVGGLDCSKCHY
jgi:hypothetical protein